MKIFYWLKLLNSQMEARTKIMSLIKVVFIFLQILTLQLTGSLNLTLIQHTLVRKN